MRSIRERRHYDMVGKVTYKGGKKHLIDDGTGDMIADHPGCDLPGKKETRPQVRFPAEGSFCASADE